MKIAPAQFRNLISNFPAHVQSVLFYGESEADVMPKLNRFIAHGMQRNLSEFQFVDASSLAKKEVFLSDLASSQSLFGPAQPIIIQKATDKLVSELEVYLQDSPKADPIIVISDAYLKPSSKLRKLYENEANLAAIACYARTLPEVMQEIEEAVKSNNKLIDRQAVQLLASQVIQGTSSLEMEVNKLIGYVGPEQERITLEDVQNSTDFTLEISEKRLYTAFLQKQWKDIPFLILAASSDIFSGIGFVRNMNAKLAQLLVLKSLLEEGKSYDQASRIVSPPVFFQDKDLMKSACRLWHVEEIKFMLAKLISMEKNLKLEVSSEASLLSMGMFFEVLNKKWKKN